MKLWIPLFLLIYGFNCLAQIPTQVIRGQILNSEGGRPIKGAGILLQGDNLQKGIFADKNGNFRFDSIPVGRYTMRISSAGYMPLLQNIILNAGKEWYNILNLNPAFIQTSQIEVHNQPFGPLNESTLLSSTVFSMEDVQRFAGTRDDPSRMVRNYAGVIGQNSLRNDIIIRGGSPTELLWRLDGLDIPNPNHFGTQGATGGPVGALNTNLLANSDFLTGAFPAIYGDKISGVFDLHTRKGNNEKYEYMLQLSYNGAEAGIEGPLPFINGSFIANYRYSFLDVLNSAGVNLGIPGIPRYQDGFIKLNLQPSEHHQIDFTFLYGANSIFIQRSNKADVATGEWDLKSNNSFYSAGLRWKYFISEDITAILQAGIANNIYNTGIDSITCDSIRTNQVIRMDPWFRQNSSEGYSTLKYSIIAKPYENHFLTLGIEYRNRIYDLSEKRFTQGWGIYTDWDLAKKGDAGQLFSFIDWNWKPFAGFTVNSGIYSQYISISKEWTFEPRFAIAWQPAAEHRFSAGISLHSQSLPLLLYYASPDMNNLSTMKSFHTIVGYSFLPLPDIQIRAEIYVKNLNDIPVSADTNDSWSFINTGANFGSVGGKSFMASAGKGQCYGAELSIIRNFSAGYYYTITASWIRQRYMGSDQVWRFGAFDNQFVLNILGGAEWKISDALTIGISTTWTMAGGAPYTPVDEQASRQRNQTIFDEKKSFSLRRPDYHKLDLKIDFRTNYKGLAIIAYFSAENVLNKKNVLEYQWNNARKITETVWQIGFFPLGGIRLEF
jgi:hypothetical protein